LKVPALKAEGSNIAESLVIIEYINDRYPEKEYVVSLLYKKKSDFNPPLFKKGYYQKVLYNALKSVLLSNTLPQRSQANGSKSWAIPNQTKLVKNIRKISMPV
jgi:hypothetical protein